MGDRVKIRDTEGVDFGWYFSTKYTMIHENRKKKLEARARE